MYYYLRNRIAKVLPFSRILNEILSESESKGKRERERERGKKDLYFVRCFISSINIAAW